jgi:glutamate N-acetyltransferase/amino-acid N-acetyltransferase
MSKIEQIAGGLGIVEGFFCDACNVGMRQGTTQGDVAFIRSNEPLDVSAVFTTNRFQAAPIKHYQRYPKDFQTNFVLINAKNANAMTGKKGIEDINTIFKHLSSKLNVLNPIMSSTGVIGYRLPVSKIVSAFDMLDFQATNSNATAKAIMTTDSFEKELSYKVTLDDGSSFRIAAICKGAGMINPAMATMLCFITTDANIPKADMDELLQSSVEQSFNRISVDGDTSTNDTVMLLSSKKSQAYDKKLFKEALDKITFELAMMILKDGEGANKVVEFEVKGAVSDEDAKKAATLLSNSLLVKTALFGEDPNWGRIASTIGASGCECDDTKLEIYYDDLLIYSDEFRELDKAREDKAYEIMKQSSFKITCDLGLGEGRYSSFGCDLSYDYVKINAEYRT